MPTNTHTNTTKPPAAHSIPQTGSKFFRCNSHNYPSS